MASKGETNGMTDASCTHTIIDIPSYLEVRQSIYINRHANIIIYSPGFIMRSIDYVSTIIIILSRLPPRIVPILNSGDCIYFI